MITALTRPASAGRGRLLRVLVLMTAGAIAWLVLAPAASAHVVPTSSIQLVVGTDEIDAAVAIPLSDLEASTGTTLESQADVDAQSEQIQQYLLAHFAPTTDDGQAWEVGIGSLSVNTTGNTATTGLYEQLQTTFTLTPPAGSDSDSFNLGYDAVVDRVATHTVIVTARTESDDSVQTVGTVRRSTVTNKVQPLHVDLASTSGFSAMFSLGVQHIREGTDHQLFLLTLLLPAPLLAVGPRWSSVVPARQAVRRIAAITLSFTLGHSVTLALGTLGVPVPQQFVESLIAVSILVAAVHAVRPVFAGREVLVAGAFGLVHGLAFSEALRELDLTGTRLAGSLLGFNLGIEAMQLLVVAMVLPPLILLARSGRYSFARNAAAAVTAVAALGWLADRLGRPNPVAELADQLGVLALPGLVILWSTAAVMMVSAGQHQRTAGAGEPGTRESQLDHVS